MPTAADIRALFPGVFAAAPTPPAADPLELAIAMATRRVLNTTLLGDRYGDAVTYLAAHFAYSTAAANIAGTPSSVTVGRVSVSYFTGGSSSYGPRTTFLGMYESLIRGIAGARIPRCC